MISADQAALMAAAIISSEQAVFLDASSETVQSAISILTGLISMIPEFGHLVDTIVEKAAETTFTVPGPTGPIVVIGKHDAAQPLSMVEAAVAQAVEAHSINSDGAIQSMVDKLGSEELRAVRDCHKMSAMIFVRYLLTGQLPKLEDAVSDVQARAALHYSDAYANMIKGMLASTLFTISLGGTPPIASAKVAHDWLVQNAKDSIVPGGWA